MSVMHKVDAELLPTLEGIIAATVGSPGLHDIPAARAGLAQLGAAMKDQQPVIEGVTSQDQMIPGPEGAPDVHVRVYQPTQRSASIPAILWIHGGGYVAGDLEGPDDLQAKKWVTELDCVVVTVDYRLAPEAPYPAPLEDCYATLKWLANHSEELGVNLARIAIGGGSAGGGLAAALALLARDRAEVEICFQLLIYPMLDDRNVTQVSDTIQDTLLWTRESNLIGWRSYLGFEPGGEDVSPYAAPARATDLAGLPPACIAVGELDLFLDENIEYARRLLSAGVPTELHVYPGAFHGFQGIVPSAAISQRMTAECDLVLKNVLKQ